MPGRLLQASPRARTILVVAVMVAALIATLVVVRDDDALPFPTFGVAVVDDPAANAQHVVSTIGRRAGGELVAPPASETAAQPTHWNGVLRWDGRSDDWLAPAGPADDLRFAQPVVAGDRLLGTQVLGFERAALLLDPDGDRVVDLAVFRRLDDPDVPALDPVVFRARDHAEVVVARASTGESLAADWAEHGLDGIACAPGPEAPTRDEDRGWTLPALELACLLADPGVEPVEDAPERAEATAAEVTAAPEARATAADVAGEEFQSAGTIGDHRLCGSQLEAWYAARAQARHLERVAERRHDSDVEARLTGLSLEATKFLWDRTKDFDTLRGIRDNPDPVQARLGMRKFVFDKVMDPVNQHLVKELTDNQGHEAAGMLVLTLVKALIERGPLPTLIADVHLWAAEQAQRAAKIFRDAGDDAAETQREVAEAKRAAYQGCHDGSRPGPGEGIGATVDGDPHLNSFDGTRFDFQAAGEYVLSTGDDFEVQARFAPLGTQPVSVTTALALRLPGATGPVMVQPGGEGGWRLGTDGENLAMTGPAAVVAGHHLTTTGRRLRLVGDDESVVVEVDRDGAGTWLTNLRVWVDAGRAAAGVAGLLGDGDGDRANDLMSADGDTMERDDNDALYRGFGESWRVADPAASLFSYEPGEGPDSFHLPDFPGAAVSLATMDQVVVEDAIRTCLSAGVWVEPMLTGCAVDVALTGDPAWVEAGRRAVEAVGPLPWRPLSLPTGLVRQPGCWTLWAGRDVTVDGCVLGIATDEEVVLALRGLRVQRGDQVEVAWPGWQDLPGALEFDETAELSVVAGTEALVVRMAGDDAALEGLAVGAAGSLQQVGADAWASDWLSVAVDQ